MKGRRTLVIYYCILLSVMKRGACVSSAYALHAHMGVHELRMLFGAPLLTRKQAILNLRIQYYGIAVQVTFTGFFWI